MWSSARSLFITWSILAVVCLSICINLVRAQLPRDESSDESLAMLNRGDGELEFLDVGDNGVCEGDRGCAMNLLQRSATIHLAHEQAEKGTKTLQHAESSLEGFLRFVQSMPPAPALLKAGLPAQFVNVAMIIVWACVSFYTLCIIWDVSKLWRLSRRQVSKAEACRDEDEQWSSTGIWMLCFYRLYTGFLAATWLPYVLAMEGEAFWPDNQSLFMGIAKLIYGVTVLMNPMFGLIGDMLAEVCQGAARRLWILLGITLSAFGIMICLWAGPKHYFCYYMLGITIWRTGESLNDVTTEAIVPELVPTSQFALASSIKAASFLMGGLLGYCLLFYMANVHYTWCYFAYLFAMFSCAIPSLLLLENDKPAPVNLHRSSKSFSANMSAAYITPCSFEGGFPQISLAIFVMSCGTAPMFFFLLIIRDLLGVHNEVALQQDFAIGSVLFFLAAAAATIVDVTYGDRIGPVSRGNYLDAAALSELSPRTRAESVTKAKTWEAEKRHRLKVLVIISIVYAVSVMLLPGVQLLKTIAGRFAWFYPLVVIFGGTFGLGYSRFQDATWRLLPYNCDMANAMGFNVMARNFGLGIGNFFFGALLEEFKVSNVSTATQTLSTTITTTSFRGVQVLTSAHQVYTRAGYDIMCFGCMCFNLLAGFIAYRIISLVPNPDEIKEAS